MQTPVKTLLLVLLLATGVAEGAAVILAAAFGGGMRLRSLGAAWHLQLVNMDTHISYYKKFTGALVLGRGQLSATADRLLLDFDTTISRRQCSLIPWQNQIYLLNLSRVNVTSCNNQLLTGKEPLQVGDVIQAGNCRYYVATLYYG